MDRNAIQDEEYKVDYAKNQALAVSVVTYRTGKNENSVSGYVPSQLHKHSSTDCGIAL